MEQKIPAKIGVIACSRPCQNYVTRFYTNCSEQIFISYLQICRDLFVQQSALACCYTLWQHCPSHL